MSQNNPYDECPIEIGTLLKEVNAKTYVLFIDPENYEKGSGFNQLVECYGLDFDKFHLDTKNSYHIAEDLKKGTGAFRVVEASEVEDFIKKREEWKKKQLQKDIVKKILKLNQ